MTVLHRFLVVSLVFSLAACEEKQHALSVVSVPMTQGSFLAGDLYLPPGAGPWPTILVQTTYGKSLWDTDRLPLDSDPNYAYLIVDTRGRGDSSEAQDSDASPGVDGYDLVEWIAEQSWSDGHVGGWGNSALGILQLQTAREAPPHLDAIVPIVAGIWDHYERYYPGGVLREEYLSLLTVLGFPNAIFARIYPTRKGLLAGPYWESREAATDYGAEIQVPTLLMSGFSDYEQFRLLRLWKQLPGTEKRLVMGPWTHGAIDEAYAGELEYAAAEHYATHSAKYFLDRHLRSVGPGLTGGPVWWHEGGVDRWNAASAWPLSTTAKTLYLRADASLASTPAASVGGSTSYGYDPADPSPTVGGAEHAPFGDDTDFGPRDQRIGVESRDDVAIFTTAVLASDLRVTGASKAVLYISSDRTDTDFMVRVTDVYPDGRSMLIVDGARKARFRNTYTVDDDLLTPGEVYELEVDLLDIANTFQAGHQLRVIVSSSNYPRFATNNNTGGPLSGFGSDAEPLVAQNSVHHSAAYPSRLELPVLQ